MKEYSSIDDEANARLIAAAPDLLATLEVLTYQLDKYHRSLTYKTEEEQKFASMITARASAYEIIKKARGES